MLSSIQLEQLLQDIKKKKELSSLSDSFVKDTLIKLLKKETKILTSLETKFNLKSTTYKVIIKLTRADLRRVYGLFRDKNETKKRQELFTQLQKEKVHTKKKELIITILETHSSTKERIVLYPQLYKQIFSITGKPKSIIDVGCGLNPFSFHYMNMEDLEYYTYDINETEIKLLKQYFSLLQKQHSFFKGKAIMHNILNKKKYPKADIALLFKITDHLDKGKGHKKTEEILTSLPVKHVVVSFPTRTMSGKKMTAPQRSWMEWLCKRLQYEYKILEFGNEIFYVITKQ